MSTITLGVISKPYSWPLKLLHRDEKRWYCSMYEMKQFLLLLILEVLVVNVKNLDTTITARRNVEPLQTLPTSRWSQFFIIGNPSVSEDLSKGYYYKVLENQVVVSRLPPPSHSQVNALPAVQSHEIRNSQKGQAELPSIPNLGFTHLVTEERSNIQNPEPVLTEVVSSRPEKEFLPEQEAAYFSYRPEKAKLFPLRQNFGRNSKQIRNQLLKPHDRFEKNNNKDSQKSEPSVSADYFNTRNLRRLSSNTTLRGNEKIEGNASSQRSPKLNEKIPLHSIRLPIRGMRHKLVSNERRILRQPEKPPSNTLAHSANLTGRRSRKQAGIETLRNENDSQETYAGRLLNNEGRAISTILYSKPTEKIRFGQRLRTLKPINAFLSKNKSEAIETVSTPGLEIRYADKTTVVQNLKPLLNSSNGNSHDKTNSEEPLHLFRISKPISTISGSIPINANSYHQNQNTNPETQRILNKNYFLRYRGAADVPIKIEVSPQSQNIVQNLTKSVISGEGVNKMELYETEFLHSNMESERKQEQAFKEALYPPPESSVPKAKNPDREINPKEIPKVNAGVPLVYISPLVAYREQFQNGPSHVSENRKNFQQSLPIQAIPNNTETFETSYLERPPQNMYNLYQHRNLNEKVSPYQTHSLYPLLPHYHIPPSQYQYLPQEYSFPVPQYNHRHPWAFATLQNHQLQQYNPLISSLPLVNHPISGHPDAQLLQPTLNSPSRHSHTRLESNDPSFSHTRVGNGDALLYSAEKMMRKESVDFSTPNTPTGSQSQMFHFGMSGSFKPVINIITERGSKLDLNHPESPKMRESRIGTLDSLVNSPTNSLLNPKSISLTHVHDIEKTNMSGNFETPNLSSSFKNRSSNTLSLLNETPPSELHSHLFKIHASENEKLTHLIDSEGFQSEKKSASEEEPLQNVTSPTLRKRISSVNSQNGNNVMEAMNRNNTESNFSTDKNFNEFMSLSNPNRKFETIPEITTSFSNSSLVDEIVFTTTPSAVELLPNDDKNNPLDTATLETHRGSSIGNITMDFLNADTVSIRAEDSNYQGKEMEIQHEKHLTTINGKNENSPDVNNELTTEAIIQTETTLTTAALTKMKNNEEIKSTTPYSFGSFTDSEDKSFLITESDMQSLNNTERPEKEITIELVTDPNGVIEFSETTTITATTEGQTNSFEIESLTNTEVVSSHTKITKLPEAAIDKVTTEVAKNLFETESSSDAEAKSSPIRNEEFFNTSTGIITTEAMTNSFEAELFTNTEDTNFMTNSDNKESEIVTLSEISIRRNSNKTQEDADISLNKTSELVKAIESVTDISLTFPTENGLRVESIMPLRRKSVENSSLEDDNNRVVNNTLQEVLPYMPTLNSSANFSNSNENQNLMEKANTFVTANSGSTFQLNFTNKSNNTTNSILKISSIPEEEITTLNPMTVTSARRVVRPDNLILREDLSVYTFKEIPLKRKSIWVSRETTTQLSVNEVTEIGSLSDSINIEEEMKRNKSNSNLKNSSDTTLHLIFHNNDSLLNKTEDLSNKMTLEERNLLKVSNLEEKEPEHNEYEVIELPKDEYIFPENTVIMPNLTLINDMTSGTFAKSNITLSNVKPVITPEVLYYESLLVRNTTGNSSEKEQDIFTTPASADIKQKNSSNENSDFSDTFADSESALESSTNSLTDNITTQNYNMPFINTKEHILNENKAINEYSTMLITTTDVEDMTEESTLIT
ncbi:uncharacterized protein LOC118185705 isoform X2 [Stegodyphus dumicola]|nr:uncharacterized protein LOC118185705 isoform X2 [Stegodyphus dumicola]XP_035211486.1 uncharacterized protein LOC118185705 isoform X2 [Stegodyphus dumicola]